MGRMADAQYEQRVTAAEAAGLWGGWYRSDDGTRKNICVRCHGWAGSVPDGIYRQGDGLEVTCSECGKHGLVSEIEGTEVKN